MNSHNLAVEVGGIIMKNPVMTASGTFGYRGKHFVPECESRRHRLWDQSKDGL
jgi:hypothetical protein